ncbi:MAG: hypothetical protein SFV51_04170 [Bryobacteraceae bacterium]|nr:hypothetical protein [Bryobacteraceae bacterium]
MSEANDTQPIPAQTAPQDDVRRLITEALREMLGEAGPGRLDFVEERLAALELRSLMGGGLLTSSRS